MNSVNPGKMISGEDPVKNIVEYLSKSFSGEEVLAAIARKLGSGSVDSPSTETKVMPYDTLGARTR